MTGQAQQQNKVNLCRYSPRILDKYRASLRKYSPGVRETLDHVRHSNGVLNGFSTLMQIQFFDAFPNLVPPKREDLEKLSMDEIGLLLPEGDDVLELGVAVIPPVDSDLIAQLTRRGIKIGRGKLVYLNAFELKEDPSFPSHLAIKLKYSGRELMQKGLVREVRDAKWNLMEDRVKESTDDFGLNSVLFGLQDGAPYWEIGDSHFETGADIKDYKIAVVKKK